LTAFGISYDTEDSLREKLKSIVVTEKVRQSSSLVEFLLVCVLDEFGVQPLKRDALIQLISDVLFVHSSDHAHAIATRTICTFPQSTEKPEARMEFSRIWSILACAMPRKLRIEAFEPAQEELK
jgi:hypothetical protein